MNDQMTFKSPILLEAQRTFKSMLEILESKGKDYAKDSDPYQNFRLAESLLGVPTRKGIAVRLLEKVSRICNLMDKSEDVKGETIDDTLNDLIGLAIVLKSKLKQERDERFLTLCKETFDTPIGSPTLRGESIKVESPSFVGTFTMPHNAGAIDGEKFVISDEVIAAFDSAMGAEPKIINRPIGEEPSHHLTDEPIDLNKPHNMYALAQEDDGGID